MRQTQRMWVEAQLREHGVVTRNTALQNFISRLGAIICDMRAEGWQITPSRRGRDYVYTLGEAPKRKVSEFVPIEIDGRRYMREVFKYV